MSKKLSIKSDEHIWRKLGKIDYVGVALFRDHLFVPTPSGLSVLHLRDP